MAFSELSTNEQSIVLQCMRLLLETHTIEAPEFQTRLGINRHELSHVVAAWPKLDDSQPDSTVTLAINNCLNEVCNGLTIDESTWRRYFDIPLKDVETVYHRWLDLVGKQGGIL